MRVKIVHAKGFLLAGKHAGPGDIVDADPAELAFLAGRWVALTPEPVFLTKLTKPPRWSRSWRRTHTTWPYVWRKR